MDNSQAVSYLESLLGRTLRVHTTDTRMFVGTFKCTDTVGGSLRFRRTIMICSFLQGY